MDIARFAQFQGYAYLVGITFVLLYVVTPIVLHTMKNIPADVLVGWYRVRWSIMSIVLLVAVLGAGIQYYQNVVPNQDLPDGRQAVRDHVSSYEGKHSR